VLCWVAENHAMSGRVSNRVMSCFIVSCRVCVVFVS
jgi:hypothetical protein